jgi:DNA-binding transcriptional ArsR family regulator
MAKPTVPDPKALRRHAGEAAAMLRMLSHEARLAVLCELTGGEKTAGDLVVSSGLSQSALSQHLAKLRDEGLVSTRRESQTIHYRLADAKAARIIALLHELYCARK